MNEKQKQKINNNANLIIKSKISSIVGDYNKTIGQRTKVVNESKQIVSDETENVINKLKEITILEYQLHIPTLDSEELIRSVKKDEDIIKLANFKINKDIGYEDITEYFDSAIGSGQSKILKSEFSPSGGKNASLYPIDLFDLDKVKTFADIFVSKGYTNSNIFRLNANKFIQYDILIKNLDSKYQLISSLSAGQLSKIYINMLIDTKLKAMENNAVIVYDQPDNNLEKTFILKTLGRKLAELKKKYQVIITTHEPLLVINSDSNNILRAENDPIAGVNNIKYENLSMFDVADKSAAIEKIASLIDGSHDAIKLRNKIYGGFDL
jgi:predicted ATPase